MDIKGGWLSLLLSGLALLLSAAVFFITAESDDTDALAVRLTKAEDELAIRRVLVDYSATQDARDYAGYAGLFAKDGEWVNGDLVYRGREAIQQMLTDLYGVPPEDYINTDSFHITFNPQINIQGDQATARSRHLLVMRGPNGEPTPMLAGRYEDKLIREKGEWKILQRVDFPVMPTSEEWREFIRVQQPE